MARSLLAAAVSGLLLAAAFPKTNAWPLAWVALVPLLAAMRGASPRRAATLGWVAGFSFFATVVYWIAPTVSNFTRLSPVLAAAVCALLCAACACWTGAFGALYERLATDARLRPLLAPAVWVAVEWTRTFLVAGFPWGSLGYSQSRAVPLIQIADLAGVYGVSALLVFFNVALTELLVGGAGRRTLAALVGVPLAVLIYGQVRLGDVERAPVVGTLPVAYVQANVAQGDKWDPRRASDNLRRHLILSDQAAERGAALIVWPEAAIPFDVERDQRAAPVGDLARRRSVPLLVGATAVEYRSGQAPRPYNRAWFVDTNGRLTQSYDKIQLVPFGEYVPLGWLFGFVDIVVEAVGEFGRGDEATVFDGPLLQTPAGEAIPGRSARFGVLICYEGIFPGLTRRFVAAGADFLINISNDAWYGRTSAPYQHMAMVAFRAVENRVPVVRATSTGVSGFIDANGSVGATTYLFESDMSVQRVLLRDMGSFYRSFGDVFVALAWMVVALFVWRARASRPEL